MRNNLLIGISSAVAAVAVAGSANAAVVPTVIDNFNTLGTLGVNGANYAGIDPAAFSVGTSGGNYMGSRLLCTNSNGGTANGTMSGNGQFTASMSATGALNSYADTQLISQYYFSSSVVDMTNSNFSTIYVSGSGTASGGGQYVGDVDMYDSNGDWIGTQPGNLVKDAYGIGVAVFTGATTTGGFDDNVFVQLNMSGTRSLGNFAFTLADLQAAHDSFDFTNVNAMFIYQYAYGNNDILGIDGGTWNYTATSFSFVPAPGAAALLGAAGLVGGRRRKA
jgi:hypothetical protein